MEVYYFGCSRVGHTGHGLYTSDGSNVRNVMDKLPFNYEHLDGFIKDQKQSTGMLLHLYAANAKWTILMVSDFSVDQRGRSNAAFIVRGYEYSLMEMLEVIPQYFPEQFKRITDAAPLKLLEVPNA